jgi:hypothetical protein
MGTWRKAVSRLSAPAFAADGLQGIIQHVADFPLGSGAGCQSNVVPPAHNQQHHLIILQGFRYYADKCSSCGIESLLFQLIQAAQALRQDHSGIESAAFGCAQSHPAAVADEQQDLRIELLRGGRNDGLQSGAIKLL